MNKGQEDDVQQYPEIEIEVIEVGRLLASCSIDDKDMSDVILISDEIRRAQLEPMPNQTSRVVRFDKKQSFEVDKKQH